MTKRTNDILESDIHRFGLNYEEVLVLNSGMRITRVAYEKEKRGSSHNQIYK
jgi:hypothetical protein